MPSGCRTGRVPMTPVAVGGSVSTSARSGSGSHTATPLETVRRERDGRHLRRLVKLAAEHEAVEVVVGLPRTLADRAGSSALDAVDLADAVAAKIAPTPVRLVDERLTTVSAQRSLRDAGVRAKNQRTMVDQVAAVAILQTWLDQRRSMQGVVDD